MWVPEKDKLRSQWKGNRPKKLATHRDQIRLPSRNNSVVLNWIEKQTNLVTLFIIMENENHEGRKQHCLSQQGIVKIILSNDFGKRNLIPNAKSEGDEKRTKGLRLTQEHCLSLVSGSCHLMNSLRHLHRLFREGVCNEKMMREMRRSENKERKSTKVRSCPVWSKKAHH